MEQNNHLMIIETMLGMTQIEDTDGTTSNFNETIKYFKNLIKENEELKEKLEQKENDYDNLKEEHEELENEKEEWETKEERYDDKIEEMEKQIKNYKINEEQKELLINDLKTKLKDEKENKKTFGVVSYENGELFEMVKEFGFDHILDMSDDEEDFDIYKFFENVHTKMGEMEKMKIEIDTLKMKLLKHKKVIMELLE